MSTKTHAGVISEIIRRFPHLGGERYRGYQPQGVAFFIGARGRAILADEVGMGKTPMALGYIGMTPTIKRTLVVAPSSILYKWQQAFDTFLGQAATVIESERQALSPYTTHLIVSWGMLVKHAVGLRALRFDAAIIDEAHKAKNPQAQRTRALERIVQHVPRLLFLSATPFINSREELYPLLHMLDSVRWPNYWKFKRDYLDDERGSERWVVQDMSDVRRARAANAQRNREKLAADIAHLYLRRLKVDHLKHLGTPTIEEVPVVLAGPQRSEYHAAQRDILAWLREHGLPTQGAERAEALVKLNRLREIVGRAKVGYTVELARDILEADPNQKVVVYAIHRDTVSAILQALTDYGVSHIVGSDSALARAKTQRDFQADGPPRVVVVSEAGEEGIDLYRAGNIIFAEIPWTPKNIDQAIGRLHRSGQVGLVTAHFPKMIGTVDTHLYRIVARKRDEAKGLITYDRPQVVQRELMRLLMEGEEVIDGS
jgi:SWI/SNF-related matrix-associated actin-dependent regulator 1 of chromatin subfamily A